MNRWAMFGRPPGWGMAGQAWRRLAILLNADWQPAGRRVGRRIERSADCQSAIQPTASRRYGVVAIREVIEDPNAAQVRAKLAEWRGQG